MLTENRITPEILAQHSLTEEEYKRVVQILGRQPNLTELGIFSVMWSEHCCYKSSQSSFKETTYKWRQSPSGPWRKCWNH